MARGAPRGNRGDAPPDTGHTHNEGSWEQTKTECGNLQLCAGFEAGIEVATHAVGQS